MSGQVFEILQCEEQSCRFRFPAIDIGSHPIACPVCGNQTAVAVRSFENQPLRNASIESQRHQLCGLLDNVRSAYNVGSMIRTASAAGLAHLYLCGITPTPEHAKVVKTSLGAERGISWSHHNNSVDIATTLESKGHQLIAIEGGIQSQWLSEFAGIKSTNQVTMIVGNEQSGVDPSLLKLCDQVLALPMLGEKTSINVTVAFGIAAYYLQYFPLLSATPT